MATQMFDFPENGSPRLRKEAVDPFLTVQAATGEMRRRIAEALKDLFPAGAFLKIDNILVDNRVVNAQNIVVTFRSKQ